MRKWVLVLIITIFCSTAWAQQKFALVIGNGNYTDLGRLRNPVNDADDMTAALTELGFSVDKILNGDLDTMENAVMRLKRNLLASKNSYGFLFYAGHGVQSNGVNYLIPVGMSIPSENFLRSRAVSVQMVLDELNDARNELNVVVLDACRDNPFTWARSGSGARGLTVMGNQPADSIVVSATSAGSTANDGEGRNGLFTSSLLKNIKTPGLEVMEIFRRTGQDVIIASDRKQIPAFYSQFFGNAYFSSPAAAQPHVTPPVAISPSPPPETPQTVITSSPTPVTSPITIAPSPPPETPQTVIGSSSTPVTPPITITPSPPPETPQAQPAASVVTVTPSSASVRSFTGITAFGGWLSNQLKNTATTPYVVKLNVSNLTGISDALFNAPQKYVYIDLSESTLSKIPNDAFYTRGRNCETLIGITIPNGVTSIGNSAFNSCTSITSVIIPNSVTTIGTNVFSSCTKLTSVTIGTSVKSIEGFVFNSCSSLSSVIIPNSVTSIGRNSFEGCSSLVSIIIPNSVKSIDGSAFNNCGSLASVIMPNSVTSIGAWAFRNCGSLASVIIGSSVTSIGDSAFANCKNLISVIIPASVTSIKDSAFNACTSLASVTFQGMININSFSDTVSFPGDLRAKFYAASKTNGTPGTYTRPSGGNTWTRQ
jgi:hypothetical protein